MGRSKRRKGQEDMYVAEDDVHWKVVLAGATGTGKTTIAMTAPAPLVLMSERQGLPSLRAAARRMGRPMPMVLVVEQADDYRQVLRSLMGDRSAPFVVRDKQGVEVLTGPWPQTVVLDSLTDAVSLLVREIREQAPPRLGKDGLPIDAQRFWGVLSDRGSALIKAFRDLPMHVLFLCLRDERTKEDEDGNVIERIVQPKLTPRSLVAELGHAVNLVGYTYRTRTKAGAEEYGVVFEGGETAFTKIMEPLRRVEVPDMSDWISRLSGHLDGPVVAAPEPPAELATVTAPAERKGEA